MADREKLQPTDFSDLALVEPQVPRVIVRRNPARKVKRARFGPDGKLMFSAVPVSEFFGKKTARKSHGVDWAGRALSGE